MRQIPMVPVPVDAGGINPARMAQALAKEGVAGVYTVPSYQNPTGVSQLARRREKVLALANQYGATVFEDDIYADLRLGGRSIRPIKSLPGGERVVYAGSFSKSLAPGLRVGFMVASGKLARDLLHFKESHDICTGRLTQAVVAAFIERGGYRRHLMRVRREYKRRRDAMLEALHTHLDVPHRVTHPKGGMHLWVMFESPLDMAGLEEMAEKRGVSFAPGTLFFTDGRRASSLRLNFSANPVETIHEGIVRLAQCIKKEIMR
jgi:DNA-binding transcriptional MocR family regulator